MAMADGFEYEHFARQGTRLVVDYQASQEEQPPADWSIMAWDGSMHEQGKQGHLQELWTCIQMAQLHAAVVADAPIKLLKEIHITNYE